MEAAGGGDSGATQREEKPAEAARKCAEKEDGGRRADHEGAADAVTFILGRRTL